MVNVSSSGRTSLDWISLSPDGETGDDTFDVDMKRPSNAAAQPRCTRGPPCPACLWTGRGARSEWLLWPALVQAQVPGPAPSPGGVSPAGGRAHWPTLNQRG